MKTTHTLPVSRKFMERMRIRVTDVMNRIGMSSTSLNDVLELINNYLVSREVPVITPGPTAISHIVFFSLKEEIDAAILRSQRARERALRRKAASMPSEALSSSGGDRPISDSNDSNPSLSNAAPQPSPSSQHPRSRIRPNGGLRLESYRYLL